MKWLILWPLALLLLPHLSKDVFEFFFCFPPCLLGCFPVAALVSRALACARVVPAPVRPHVLLAMVTLCTCVIRLSNLVISIHCPTIRSRATVTLLCIGGPLFETTSAFACCFLPEKLIAQGCLVCPSNSLELLGAASPVWVRCADLTSKRFLHLSLWSAALHSQHLPRACIFAARRPLWDGATRNASRPFKHQLRPPLSAL
mmetsp:Transcript_43153/g.101402  ORF Transcript_43153/g.101402 Transcript_43153/m.101402 type:complete len:202 (+) Transcript_43153:360-965(+)